MLKLDHVAVQVADLDAAIAFYTDNLHLDLLFRRIDPEHHEAFAFLQLDCGQHGIPIVKGPLEIPGVVRWLYVHDPDNNLIEFVQWMRDPVV